MAPCDRCNAHAYVHVTLDTGGTLSWCGHHYRQHEEALLAYVVETVDERDLLTT